MNSKEQAIHKYERDKTKLICSEKWLNMTPAERDQAIRDLADKWKV